MIIDTHCHIYPSEIDNAEEIIKECEKNNIYMILNGIDPSSNKEVLYLADKYDNVYAALGYDHSTVDKIKETDIELLDEQLNNEKVIAVGEIGLDYYQNPTDEIIRQQKLFFTDQIKLANKYNLPIIIHVRDQKTKALDDCLELLKKHNKTSKILIHFFTGNREICERIIACGYYVSLSGVVTFKNSKEINEALDLIPLNRLLIETDAPYATPVPYRGEINKPYYLENIYEYLQKKLKNNDL